MEDIVLRYAEYGILGVITLLLLTRGLTVLTRLSDTTKALADSITTLTKTVAEMGHQLNSVAFQVEGIEKHLGKFEENSAKSFGELRDLLKKSQL